MVGLDMVERGSDSPLTPPFFLIRQVRQLPDFFGALAMVKNF